MVYVTGVSLPAKLTERHLHLSRGASYLIIQNLGVNAVTILSFAVLARLISPEQMGTYAILQLVSGTCTAFFTWFPQAVTKFVAENVSKGQRSVAAAAFYQSLRANLVIYLPVVLSIYLYAKPLASHLLGGPSYALLFQFLAIDLLFNPCIYVIVLQALLGVGLFREVAVVGLVVGGFLRQLLIISLILVMRNFTGLVIGWLASDAAAVGIYLALAVRALGGPRFDFPLTKLVRYYLPIEFASITIYGQNWFDRVLLVLFVPLATLGIYNAALTAFSVLTGVTNGVANMLLPAYSSIEGGRGGGSEMPSAVRLATRYTCLTLIPLAFGLLAVAKPALTLFVGQPYLAGSLPLAIISGAFAVTVFVQALTPVFLALEETTASAGITGFSVLVSLVLAYVLLPEWGIVGTSFARALQIVLSAILTVVILRRKMKLQLDFRIIARTTLAGGVMATVVSAIELVVYDKWMLPGYLFIGAVTYLIMLRWLRVVDASDLHLLRRLLGKRMAIVSNFLSWALLAKPRVVCDSCGYGNQIDSIFCASCGVNLQTRSSEQS